MSVQALGWVFDHSPTGGTDRLILLAIANHAGKSPADGAWESWPGTDLLQREAGLDRSRTVKDALARLVDQGHLERLINGAPDERIRKDRRPNLYRILLANGVTCGDTRCGWCGVTPDAERGDARRPDGVTDGDRTGCRDASPEPLVNREAEPEEQPMSLVLAVPVVDLFDDFWAAYPRRSAKPDARRAWVRAAQRAAPAAIVDGARRYAADPNLPAPAYIPHPATWLNGDRWGDPPLPSRTFTPAANRDLIDDRAAPSGRISL